MKTTSGILILDIQTSLATQGSLPEKRNLLIWKVLFVAVLLLFAVVTAPYQGSAEFNLTGDNLVKLTNESRIKAGLSPLKTSLKLEQAAQAKAQNMLENKYFAHVSPSGVKPWDFIKNTGFKYAYAGENLAINYTSAYELATDFLQSPSHRENLLSPLFSEVGIAVAGARINGEYTTVVVEMFASPVSDQVASAK